MMQSWRWHFLALTLVVLLQVLVIGAEIPPDGRSTTPDIASDTHPNEGKGPVTPNGLGLGARKSNDHGYSAEQPAVDAALNILQKLKATTRRYERPSGVFGYATRYARELFYLLFMNGPPIDSHASAQTHKKNPQLAEAVHLLKGAAAENNSDALFLLAEMNFHGNFTHPRDYAEAFHRYQALATLTGNSTAQYMIGFMYATGIGNAVERNQGQALLYHSFAAMGGDTRSQMTLAFRRYVGIGTPRDCDEAAYYYKQVADKAIAWYNSGPPGGRSLTKKSYRWADDNGGVYGEGASVSSAGLNANKDSIHTSSESSLEDVLEYLDLLAKKGDVKATFSLGKMYYDGSQHLPRNFRKAMMYFGTVARKYWTKDGKVNPNHPKGIEMIAAKSAGHIGRMFLRGEGIEQNFEKAHLWFKRGRANGDAICQHNLGLMFLDGLSVRQDIMKAVSYFKAASEQDYFPAEIRLGALFLDQGDVTTATRYFELAARYGAIEAFYYLAEIADRGIGGERHCGVATAYYKMVAEKAEGLHSSFAEANDAYERGDKETALISAMMAAEQGYESAQSNVAYLLDEKTSVLSLDPILPWPRSHQSSVIRNAALGLIYWTRSARQANVDAMVKMGDYYFYGLGTKPDVEKASTCYHTAAESHSAQALWHLGWMHENGLGVDQDFHMAKRYYDLALETNDEAYLPVKLSLIRLRMRSFWNRVTHGKANSIQSEPEQNAPRSFKEWITAFITYDEDEEAYLHEQRIQGSNADQAGDVLDDSGNAHDQNAHGQDGYYDDLDLDIEDGILESLIIVGLAATLVVLLHFRQQRALRRGGDQNNAVPATNNVNSNNDQNQGQNQGAGAAGNAAGDVPGRRQEEQEEGRGLFPGPDDPEYAAWVAGGVGH